MTGDWGCALKGFLKWGVLFRTNLKWKVAMSLADKIQTKNFSSKLVFTK
jgi:hypothetical protein